MRPTRARRLATAALAALLWPAAAHALALRTSAAALVLDELSPGKRYEAAVVAGRPLGVLNTGTEAALVKLRAASPPPDGLQDGYDPAPDGWVTLSPTQLALSPGEEKRCEAHVAVPRDSSLAGKQLQADWVADAVGKTGLTLALRSKLLLRVEPDRSRVEKARKGAVKRKDVEVLVLPMEAEVRDVPLGRRFALKERGVSLKLTNPGAERVTFRVETQDARPDEATREFLPAPNPGWLKPARDVVDGPAGKVVEDELFLEVPDQPRYRGRSWTFVVEVEALEAETPQVLRYRLRATTQVETRTGR